MSFIAQTTEQFAQTIFERSGMDRLIRESAWEAFIARGLPTRRVENWRYTSLRLLDHHASEQLLDMHSFDNIVSELPKAFYQLVFMDGEYSPLCSDIPEQITVSPSLQSQSAQIDPDKHPMAVLNMAMTHSGLEITIPAGVMLDKPIMLVHLSGARSSGKTHYINHRIKLGEGARATIVPYYLGVSRARFANNILVNIELAENAHLGYYSANTESEESIHIEGVHVQQQAGSAFDAFVFSRGSRLSRFDMNTVYLGTSAAANLNGVYIVDLDRHTDIHLNAEHIAPHCTTRQSVRGLAAGTAKAVFNGRVCVHKKAVKSYSEQSSHNLLLSSTACVYAKPELEIYNDDVKCSHGATVGQLDNEALFYLMSRGIPEDEAKNVLKRAFVEQQFDLIQDQTTCDYFHHLLREIS